MSADTPRHRIPIGEVYFQWDRGDRHHLVLDLAGPLPEGVVEAAGESVPLGEYLGRHPGRREEVRRLIRHRLLPPARSADRCRPPTGSPAGRRHRVPRVHRS